MTKEEGGVEGILRARLDEVRAKLSEQREELRPLEEEERKLDRMIKEYTSGSMGSADITDEQIVVWLRRNAHEDDRRSTREVAEAFNGDGRGFSKRLPRMVRDKMIAGDPQAGYYIAFSTGKKTPAKTAEKASAR